MRYLSRPSTGIITVVLLLSLSHGSEDALSLLQRNHFVEAIATWEKEANSVQISQSKLRAIKGQALAYHKLGVLYSLFDRTFKELVDEYYHTISKYYPSPTLTLYQGQAAFHRESYIKAQMLMEKVINDPNSSSLERDMAKVYRHYSVNFIKKKKGRLILKSRHSEVIWQQTQLDERATLPRNLKTNHVRSLGNMLLILIRQKSPNERLIQDALKKLMRLGDEAEIILNKGNLTQVNFYNPQLYNVLSKSFFTMSNIRYHYLLKVEDNYPELSKKFKTKFCLSENYYHLGNYDKANKYLRNPKNSNEQLLSARINARLGKKKVAKSILDNIEKKSASVMREVGFAYFDLDLQKVKGLRLTATATQKKGTSPYYRKYGLILLGLEKYQKALEIFGKGYKIQYRNSIDHIDPEYMIDYAYTIFKASKMRYEEVVETFYHLQKAFPACRPLHYCMQGIAAAETGAFGSTKIFKKGG